LETICLKMMEKDPDKRYQTAGNVAEDLRRYVNRFAISARRVGLVGKVVRWTKRNRGIAAASLCFVVLLGLLAGVFTYREHVARHQLLEEKIERAMLIAMTGDLDGAEKAIGEAEVLGTSPGSVRMIRGLLALHWGDAPKAIEHLEQAVKLLPRSVAAHSLLAAAYIGAYQLDRYEIIMDSIEKLTAVTPEDYLFKGYAESIYDPPRALKTLNEAIRRRDSTIARGLRASARAAVAQDAGNVDMAQSAIDDAYVAKAMMPGNPISTTVSLLAHLVATGVLRDAGEKDRADASLRQAGRDARELEQSPALPMRYTYYGWCYLNLTAQEEAAHEVARRGYQEAEGAVTRNIYVYSLYERGEFEKALQVLASGGDPTNPIIVAELPDGPSRALQAYRENSKLFTKGYAVIWNQATLLLLGRREEAIAASKELLNHPEQLAGLRREHNLRILDYCGGGLPEEEFLKAEAGSKWNQCESHFYVALDRLSQGDRAGAREHFQKALATGVFVFGEYQWSRLFLKRMDQDPAWPSWIPLQEPATQPTPNPRQ
jgi:tetratricopeptide (TPR) repeat protein